MKIGVGVGVYGRDTQDTQHSLITEIELTFSKPFCSLEISLNGNSENFSLNYKTEKFHSTLEKSLKERGLGVLDLTSISNLYHIKLVDHLLFHTIKKGMLLVSSLVASEIHSLNPLGKIQDLVREAHHRATLLTGKLEHKFKKLVKVVDESQMQVYDRLPLIKKAKDELQDNLLRKYLLVVNQLIELQRNVEPPNTHLSQQVENFIKSL
jgi:hypothetical protein